MNAFSAILLDGKAVEVPESLKDFIAIDNQGIEGFEFMLKHPKLSERIPDNVRADYVTFYSKINALIHEQISKLRMSLDEVEKDPTAIIHDIINRS